MSQSAPPVADFRALYAEAFERFGARALWNRRQLPDPTPGDALVVARALRREGNMAARRLAERIEAVAHASDWRTDRGAGRHRRLARP